MVRADHTVNSSLVRSDQLGNELRSFSCRVTDTDLSSSVRPAGTPRPALPGQRRHVPPRTERSPPPRGDITRSSQARAAGSHASPSPTTASAPIRVVRERRETQLSATSATASRPPASRAISAKRRVQGSAQTGLFRKRNMLSAMKGTHAAKPATPDCRPCHRQTSSSPAASIAISWSRGPLSCPHGPRPLTSASCALRNLPVCATP